MQRIVAGSFLGTGAALILGIGFVPDYVRVTNVKSAKVAQIDYKALAGEPSQIEGVLEQAVTDNGTTGAKSRMGLTMGQGIAPYMGADVITSLSTSSLSEDEDKDKRYDGDGDDIMSFMLDDVSQRQGHFNAPVASTVGVGSKVIIGTSTFTIVVMTNSGAGNKEVTLDRAPLMTTGTVMYLGPKVEWVATRAKRTMSAGFMMNETGVVNVAGERCIFEAGLY